MDNEREYVELAVSGYRVNDKVKRIADILGGVDYNDKALQVRQLQPQLMEHGLVVAYPESDDLLEFAGMIEDELDAYRGVTVKFNKDGIVQNKCKDSDCPHFLEAEGKAKLFIKLVSDDGPYCFETNIPHCTFDIMEDGEKYGEGIVFSFDALRIWRGVNEG